MSARTVLSSDDIDRSINRIAHEILESLSSNNSGSPVDLVILGIPTRGVQLAERIARIICSKYPGITREDIQGCIDITMYRDDLNSQPTRNVLGTQIPKQGIDNKVVVLVDDVLFSGRTVRAALDALNDYGRPKAVQLAVLVDRGHRQLPIKADFVGKNLPTSKEERINVQLSEIDDLNSVEISS